MAEYIEREDLIRQIRLQANRTSLGESSEPYMTWQDVVRLIQDAPAADVVEVVRCKDCKHRNHDSIRRPWCDMWEAMLFDDAIFCSYGERKEGDG